MFLHCRNRWIRLLYKLAVEEISVSCIMVKVLEVCIWEQTRWLANLLQLLQFQGTSQIR